MATAPVKEEIENKVNKTNYIKEAFAKLGLKASAQDVAAYIKQNKGETVKTNYIYVIKNKIVNPNKPKKAATKNTEKFSSVNVSRRQKISALSASANQFAEVYSNIRMLITYFGSKSELVKAINAF